jgi:hypothetical protein
MEKFSHETRIIYAALKYFKKLMGNIGFSCDCVFEEPVAGTHKMNVGTSHLLIITVRQFDG